MSFDSPVMIMIHVAGFAFFVSVAISGFMVFAGLLDRPGQRSNHSKIVPTAGGVGIVAGLGAGMLALALLYPAYGNQNLLGSLAALGVGTALLGLFDDIFDVNSKVKFGLIVLLASASVYTVGAPELFPSIAGGGLKIPYWLGFLGAVLWVFVVTNGVNFMDGANGLMASSMALSFLALCLIAVLVGASDTALISLIMAAALCGFLLYNAGNQARIFSGDVGSLLVGFLFASATLLLLTEAPAFGLLYVGPLLILPFLTDILLTLFLRARRRENLLAAHSSHLYQRMIRAGKSHVFISWLYAFAALIMGAVTLGALWYGMIKSLSFLALWVCVMTVIYLLIHKKLSSLAKPQSPQDE